MSKEMSVHNHFYRRLQRHAQISVLMRAGQAAAAPQSGEGTSSSQESATTPLPLVQARLASAATGAVSAPRQPASQPSNEAARPPAKAPTEAPAPAAASHAAAPAPSHDDAPDGDRSWQRLQTIMRKHEVRPKTEDSAPVPPTPSRRAAHVLQREPATSPPKAGRKATSTPQRRGENAAESPPATEEGNLDALPTIPAASEQDKRQDTPSFPRSRQEAAEVRQHGDAVSRPETAQSGAPQESVPHAAEPPNLERSENRSGASEQPATTLEDGVVQREPAAGSTAEGSSPRASTTHDTETDATADAESPAPRDADRSAPPDERRPTTADDGDTTGPGDQDAGARPAARAPVQVQRAPHRDELHDSAATDAPPAQDRPLTPAREAPAHDKSNEETRPLQAVWPVQRKESGATTEREPASDPPPEEPPVAGSAQKSLPHDDVALLQKVRSALETMSSRPTASSVELVLPRRPRPAAQRKPAQQDDTRKEAPEGKKETVVQTDIGPLPADLWQLLDDGRSPAPPSDGPGQQDTTPLPRQSPDPAPLQRAPEADPPAPSPSLAQSAITQATQVAENEMVVEGDDETDHEEPAAIDIDALARQVLTRLRRRLAVEWERGRGRI